MPRKGTGKYADDWPEIAQKVKDEANWCCVRCGHPHEPETGYCLTVHHLDMDRANCEWHNTPALCQKCHLQIQAKVKMEQIWMWEHTPWFRPYVAGYYAWACLGEKLTKEEVMLRLDELLELGKPK